MLLWWSEFLWCWGHRTGVHGVARVDSDHAECLSLYITVLWHLIRQFWLICWHNIYHSCNAHTCEYRLTNCNQCWTLQPVWSAVPTSSTEACRDSSIPSYIGWMFLSESCTNSASWCSTVCTVKRLCISWNCAYKSQVSHDVILQMTVRWTL